MAVTFVGGSGADWGIRTGVDGDDGSLDQAELDATTVNVYIEPLMRLGTEQERLVVEQVDPPGLAVTR